MSEVFKFCKGELSLDAYKLDVIEISLNISKGKPGKNIKNKLLNGEYQVLGQLDNLCQPNNSKIKKGRIWNLKLIHENKFSILPILFIEITDIKNEKHLRKYTWTFLAVNKPPTDNLGLLPFEIGEISLEELILELGGRSSSKVIFDQEGGFTL